MWFMIWAAARHYGARAVGIEIDPLRHLWCQILITVLGLRDRVRVVHGSFYKQDLSEADVVACYLLTCTISASASIDTGLSTF